MPDVSFSEQNIDIRQYALHHTDIEQSLREYFNTNQNPRMRFSGYKPDEVIKELDERLSELDMTSSFAILSALEAIFRIDYLQRCYRREKDPLSRAFRDLHKRKRSRVRLEEEILDLWRAHTSGANQLIGDLKRALKYRHWLAHGRYWEPKFGKNEYDFVSLYTLASTVVTKFPLLGI